MKKIISTLIVLNLFFALSAAELTAKFVTTEAAKKDSLDESLTYLRSQVAKMNLAAQKRATYIFIASLEEQMALYDQAQKSYAQAASIAAGDAEGMPKKSNEEIVLDAVRCALSSGDYMTADSYLNSAVRNTKDEKIQAYIKLYTQWSALCRAESVDDIQEPLVMLQAYVKLESMESLRPAIYLTLWYLTGDKSYSNLISSKYPKSPEAAIVKGDVQLLPTPFWFFVPKSGEAEQGTGTYAESLAAASEGQASASSSKAKASQTSSSDKITKWQLGLFRTQSNAKLLVDELKAKGFEAYVTSETRASGTTYYIVLVNEDKSGNMADKLRNAGYDCYAVD
ncbi:MAG: SPOR domain-containing protein [Treponema sp.]|nr:SPOR domain-containing protein [Treponema sp.]